MSLTNSECEVLAEVRDIEDRFFGPAQTIGVPIRWWESGKYHGPMLTPKQRMAKRKAGAIAQEQRRKEYRRKLGFFGCLALGVVQFLEERFNLLED